jgi:hypothetical protein
MLTGPQDMLTGTQVIAMLPRHPKTISGHSESQSGQTKRFNRHSRRLSRHVNMPQYPQDIANAP